MIALLKKELRVSLREKTSWALLASMPALFLLFGFMNLRDYDYSGCTPLMAAEAGRQLLSTALHVQIFGMMLLVPILAATNLVREGDRKTLEVLLTTPRGALELALAKLLSPALVALLSCLLAMPLLAALPFLGGVRPWEPIAGFGAVVLAALVASAGGLAAGALGRTTAASVILAALGAGVACMFTSWPAWGNSSNILGASLPLGVLRMVLQREDLCLFDRHVPMLLPALAFLPLVAACLLFAALPALSTPYRRRALPVRLTGGAAMALALAYGALEVVSTGSVSGISDMGVFMMVFACLASSALLAVERCDTAGFLRTLPGSAEAEGNAAGSFARRVLASRAGLALLPVLATVPALTVFASWCCLAGKGHDHLELTALGFVYAVAWALLGSGLSGFVASRGRAWVEGFLAALGPGALVAYGWGMRMVEARREVCGVDPLGVLCPLANPSSSELEQVRLAVASHTVAAWALALAALGVACVLGRRRAARG